MFTSGEDGLAKRSELVSVFLSISLVSFTSRWMCFSSAAILQLVGCGVYAVNDWLLEWHLFKGRGVYCGQDCSRAWMVQCQLIQLKHSSERGQPCSTDSVVCWPCKSCLQVYGTWQVLSVDDDIINQEVIEAILRPDGYNIERQMSGFDALSYLDRCVVFPDIILLDVNMPGMSGYTVCYLASATPNHAWHRALWQELSVS